MCEEVVIKNVHQTDITHLNMRKVGCQIGIRYGCGCEQWCGVKSSETTEGVEEIKTWYGIEWHGMAWHGMACHSMAWHVIA